MGKRSSKKYYHSKNARPTAPTSTSAASPSPPPKLSQTEWDRLAEDPQLGHAFKQLNIALQQAQHRAQEQSRATNLPVQQVLDVRHAIRILDENPILVRYLADVRERQDAIQAAMNRSDLDMLKAAGAGAGTGGLDRNAPQAMASAANLGSTWVGEKNRPEGIPDARMLRDWADRDSLLRIGIGKLRRWVERADITIIPDDETKSYNKQIMKKLEDLYNYPNRYLDSPRSLVGPVVEDILVLDSGAIEKNMTVGRQPVELFYQDGATIKIYPNWSGDPKEPRYLYDPGGQANKRALRNDELILMSENVTSWRFRYSRVQFLRDEIIADLRATKAAMRMVEQKPPPHIVQLPNATGPQLDTVRARYDSEFQGERELLFMGGPETMQVHNLVYSLKDQQWLEWQVYLARKIATMLGLSPQEMGITFDVNRATAEVQESATENSGFIPLLLLLEEYWNRELLADFCPRDQYQRPNLSKVNLRMMYPQVTEEARRLNALEAVKLAQIGMAGLPSMTLNQVLAMRGEKPVRGGDIFWVDTTNGPMPWLGYENEMGDYDPLSTAGTLGSQDASGGIEESGDDPTGTTDPEHTDNTEGNAGNGTGENASGNTGGSSDQGSAGDTGSGPATTTGYRPAYESGFNSQGRLIEVSQVSSVDPRRPGRAWSPSLAAARAMQLRGSGSRKSGTGLVLNHLPSSKKVTRSTQQAEQPGMTRPSLTKQIAALFDGIITRGTRTVEAGANISTAFSFTQSDSQSMADLLARGYLDAKQSAYEKAASTVASRILIAPRQSQVSDMAQAASWSHTQTQSIAATYQQMIASLIEELSRESPDESGQVPVTEGFPNLRALAAGVKAGAKAFVEWKAPQIANVTIGTGANDGTDQAIDDIIDGFADPSSEGDPNGVRVRVIPAESSNDLCSEYAGNNYSLDEAVDVPDFPIHPNCPHEKEVYLTEGVL